MKNTNKAADLLIAIAVIIIAGIFLAQSLKMPVPDRGIGAGTYPSIICYVLIVLSAVQIIKVLVECKGIPVIDFKNTNTRYLLRALIMILGTWLYYKLLKKVGFLILTPLYFFGSSMLFGYKKKIKCAIIAVVFSTAIYFLFVKVFMVILPRGILG